MHTQFEDEHCETRCSGRDPCLFFREGSAPSLHSNSVSSGCPQRAHRCRALLPCRSASRTTIPRLRWTRSHNELQTQSQQTELTESEHIISGAGSERGESYLAPINKWSSALEALHDVRVESQGIENQILMIPIYLPCSIRNMTGGPSPNKQQRPSAASNASCEF